MGALFSGPPSAPPIPTPPPVPTPPPAASPATQANSSVSQAGAGQRGKAAAAFNGAGTVGAQGPAGDLTKPPTAKATLLGGGQ